MFLAFKTLKGSYVAISLSTTLYSLFYELCNKNKKKHITYEKMEILVNIQGLDTFSISILYHQKNKSLRL